MEYLRWILLLAGILFILVLYLLGRRHRGRDHYSSDLDGGQEALEHIILFKERYPEVTLVYGHDLRTH